MKKRSRAPDRRRRAAGLGAHPERRVLAPGRRAALRRPAAGRTRPAVVLPSVVNMFELPDAASPVVSQAALGSIVGVLESRRGFHLVETPDRYRGWIRSAALRPATARFGRVYRVRSLMAQIYRERDVTSASPITTAPLLAPLEVVEERQEWKRVRLPDGRHGWAQSGDLEPAPARRPSTAPSRAEGAAVAATALRFLGLPYVWGGTTPFGLDCSGLAQLVYRLHGLLLPRDADLQFAAIGLAPIDRRTIRPGDLVFFGPDSGNVTHVGIALDRSRFVSATTYGTPMVRVDRLDDPYWKKLYRGARRPRGARL